MKQTDFSMFLTSRSLSDPKFKYSSVLSLIFVKVNGFSKNSIYEYIRGVKPTDKNKIKETT